MWTISNKNTCFLDMQTEACDISVDIAVYDVQDTTGTFSENYFEAYERMTW